MAGCTGTAVMACRAFTFFGAAILRAPRCQTCQPSCLYERRIQSEKGNRIYRKSVPLFSKIELANHQLHRVFQSTRCRFPREKDFIDIVQAMKGDSVPLMCSVGKRIIHQGYEPTIRIHFLELRRFIDDFVGTLVDVAPGLNPFHIDCNFDGLALSRIGRIDLEFFAVTFELAFVRRPRWKPGS